MPDFVVVGGGIGGLVAARALAESGRSVVLVEATDHLGGTVARHTVGGIDLDAGAESFSTRGGIVAGLATALGLGAEIVEPNPAGAWLQSANGKANPLPELSLLGIPGSPLARDVTAIIGLRAGLRAQLEALVPSFYGEKAASLGELVRKRMGTAVLEQLVAPIVRGVHSADPMHLDIDRVAPGLRTALVRTGSLAHAVMDLRSDSARAGSAVAGIRGGINRLVVELEADLERFGVDVRLNQRVTSVEKGHVNVGRERIDGQVVLAAPGVLEPVEGRRVVLATLVVEEPRLDAAPRGSGMLVAAGAPGIRAKALTHSTAKWAWLAERAGGKHVLRLSYDDAGPELAETARRDASTLLGVDLRPEQVVDFARVEWTRPTPLTYSPDGISVVGETAAGTGLAAIAAQSTATTARLLQQPGE